MDSIPSPSPSHSMKIQIMSGKVCLKCKGKTLLGLVNKLLKTKSLLTSPSDVLPLHLKQTFPRIIWIFTEGEGDGIKFRLPFKIFSTLKIKITYCSSSFASSAALRAFSSFIVLAFPSKWLFSLSVKFLHWNIRNMTCFKENFH